MTATMADRQKVMIHWDAIPRVVAGRGANSPESISQAISDAYDDSRWVGYDDLPPISRSDPSYQAVLEWIQLGNLGRYEDGVLAAKLWLEGWIRHSVNRP